jgi:hypothetical protein
MRNRWQPGFRAWQSRLSWWQPCDKLPEAERAAWGKFWAEVDDVLQRLSKAR